MLYVTTRNKTDTVTALQVLQEDRGTDGGFFVPVSHPCFSGEELTSLAEQGFSACVAEVLNRLFPVSLSAWDIRFCIGRKPVRIQPLGHRTSVAETWHNPQWDYEYLVKRISMALGSQGEESGDWTRIAIRIAVLFGVYSDLTKTGVNSFDVAVLSGDFTAAISAWYARQWGLPIGSILCCCNENHELWNLICHGELRTDGVSLSTEIPEADVSVPKALERLVFSCGDTEEVSAYLEACRSGRGYVPGKTTLEKMREGLYVSVVSAQRALETISGIYHTHGYLATPQTALAYAGLMDYRTKTGTIRQTVILADHSPKGLLHTISNAIGLSEEELQQHL